MSPRSLSWIISTLLLLISSVCCASPSVNMESLYSCFRVKSPQDLVQTPVVVVGQTPYSKDDFVASLLRDFSRQNSLQFCQNVFLEDGDADVYSDMKLTIPSEMFSCNVIMGADLALGLSADFDLLKSPMHIALFQDPIEATLADFYAASQMTAHPKHDVLSSMSLHEAIIQAGGLPDVDRHKAVLSFNRMTWLLCGYDCSPSNMTIHEALEKATRNLNARVLATMTVGSSLWSSLAQLSSVGPTMKPMRKPRLAAKLTSAEISILEHSNFADRILYSIALGRETIMRKCLRTAAHLPSERLIRI